MEYTAYGIIVVSPESKLRLNSESNFVTSTKTNVVLSSNSDEKLSLTIKLEAENDKSALELARLELSRICDLLSFCQNVSIYDNTITGMTYTKTNTEGNSHVVIVQTARIFMKSDVVLVLGDKSLDTLINSFEKEYSAECQDAVYMWREALSNQTPVLRYLLLYRLLEYLFDNDTNELTSWVLNKEPKVQRVSDRRRGVVTIYTSLRDNIHPKGKTFPMQQIIENESRLQNLVKQRIKEKFNI